MNARKIKILGLFLFVCTVLLLGLAACKVEPAADTEKKWTVTIDPNGKNLGGTLTVSVSDGATATLPSDLVMPTNYEAAYYSTAKDDFSKPFEFGTTKVTADITVYPHYRYAADKVTNVISGAWLNTTGYTVPNDYLYRINADKTLNGYCYAQESGAFLNLADTQNKDVLTDLIALAFDSTEPPYQTGGIKNYSGRDIDRTCNYVEPLALVYDSKDTEVLTVTNNRFYSSTAQGFKMEIIDDSTIKLIHPDSQIIQLKKVN